MPAAARLQGGAAVPALPCTEQNANFQPDWLQDPEGLRMPIAGPAPGRRRGSGAPVRRGRQVLKTRTGSPLQGL